MKSFRRLLHIVPIAMLWIAAARGGVVGARQASPVAQSESSTSEGAMFRFDLGRSGVFPSTVPAIAPVERLRIPLRLKDTEQGPRDSPSSIVVVDGVIYVSDAYRFHAFDASTGVEKWGQAPPSAFGSPTVSDGIVLNSSGEGLIAYDAASGNELWRFLPGGPVINGLPPNIMDSAPAIVDGVVYLGGVGAGGLYALDLQTGAQRWKFDTRGASFVAPAIVDDLVFFGTDGSFQADPTARVPSAVYAVERESGQQRWQRDLDEGDFVLSGPAAVDGVVYVGISNLVLNIGYVIALDAATGGERWRSTVDAPMAAGSIAVGDGHVIVPGGQSGTVASLDAVTGKEQWIFSGPTAVFGSPSLGTDAVVYLDNDRVVRALDLATGNLRWEVDTGGGTGIIVLGSPWLADGLIYARANGAVVVLG